MDCPDGLLPTREGNCVEPPDGGGGGDAGPTDGGADSGGGDSGGTGQGSLVDFEEGHPIDVRGSVELEFFEFVDAEVLSEDYGLAVGQGGWAIVDMRDGSRVLQRNTERGYYISVVGDVAWVGAKYRGTYRLDLSDPTDPVETHGPLHAEDRAHHDIAYDGQYVVLSFLSDGLEIWDESAFPADPPDVPPLHTVPMAAARALHFVAGDRLLVTDEVDDQPQLVLLDVADWDDVQELARVDLPGLGHDLAVEGAHVAVAMGGNGVEVFDLTGDVLTSRGTLSMPGAALGVDIDGDALWVGAWEQYAVAWLGEGGPVVLGHQAPTESAMGIGAGYGLALVPDWFHTTAAALVPRTGGPELVVAERLYLEDDQTDAERLEFWNAGAFPLTVTLTAGEGLGLSETRLTLAPDARQSVLVEPDGSGRSTTIELATNDPDEGDVRVVVAEGRGVGERHQDFALQAIEWPGGELTTRRLTDFEGEVVFLAYWAEF